MAAAVDVAYLSTHLGVAQDTLQTVANTPTAQLVQAVLEAVTAKAREHDDLYAKKLQLDIELESNVRGSESRADTFKATANKALNDLEEVRRKLHQEEQSRQSVENELETLKSSSSTSLSEIDTLRARIASLETSNRDTLSILDSKTTANTELSEELQKQHQKNLKLGQEIAALQQSTQVAQAAANSSKFREQSLQQELEFARRNSEWLENELKTKSEESLKYRKEKGGRIAELQRLNEEANSNVDSLSRNEQQLRSRLDVAQRKADEALSKVQQLQEAAARTEEGFRAELESSKRLVELKEQQTETHRNRLREVELRLEQVKDEGADEVQRVRRELEQVREDLQQSEQRIQELESEVDKLQAMISSSPPAQPGSVPQTPRANGSMLRAASPFGTPGSIRSKSTISAAQAMEELYKTKADLAGERRRTQQLAQELDDMMSALEAKQPEIQDLHDEAERLRAENIHMSTLADESFQQRDLATKAARKAEKANETAQAEIKILHAQLRDLSVQIQLLMFNMQAREKGMDELNEEELQHFERLQKGQITENSLADMSDTHQFITERFVAFKDMHELQEKNMDLLRLTRQLADKMENDEAAAAQKQVAEVNAELKTQKAAIAKAQDDLKSATTRMKSYMSERDMFRRMLQQKASAAEIASVLGQSVDGSQREVLASIEQHSTSDDRDLAIALRELQNAFDSYRNEQGVDSQTKREQMEKLSTERNSLHAEIARISSQLTLASERYEMLHSNFVATQNENKELQRRNQTLSESAAKQDIRTQQVAEDLVEARGLLESMRSETANLKAEKTLWKGIQERIGQDNENLVQEKARLNSLHASQQSLQNERELTEAESKRRLQNRTDSLEAELSSTKRKLAEEVEEAKKLQLRKEYEAQQAQKRIDDLMLAVNQNKEELVATKTSRDHLQARVDELTIELRSAEERTQRLQPRPTPRAQHVSQQETDEEAADARIQELEDELGDLRRDLELARAHLENAKAETESFKQLAKTTEEDLNDFNESQTQYRQEMDALLQTKDDKISELESRVQDLSTELANSNNQLTSLRDSQADVSRKYEDEKRILESEISRLKTEEDRFSEEKKVFKADLREQSEIASKAQHDYEQELVKHADAARSLQSLRAEHNQLRTESASLRAEAESAKLTLTQSEASWEERRRQFEQEISELKARRDDTNAQNKLLHQQLESVQTQIVSLQDKRTSFGENGSDTPSAIADANTEGLRELANYLRREKEILEVQHDLKVQESKRLQQQLDYAQSQLDEARLKLEQERQAQADSSRTSISHKELMEKLNELNLIRESNVTLRSETQQAQAQLVQKNARVEELGSQIQPLEARLTELENQKAYLEEEAKQLTEDRDRWQKRTEGILTKYGRVDPAEMEELKQKLSDLEAERDSLKESEGPLQTKIKELESTLENEKASWTATKTSLIAQAKAKARDQSTAIKDLQAQQSELQERVEQANEWLGSLEKELEAATAEKTAMEGKIATLQQQVQATASAPQAPTEQPETTANQDGDRREDVAALQEQLNTLNSQKVELQQDVENLRSQLSSVTQARDQAISEAQAQAEAMAAAQGQQQDAPGTEDVSMQGNMAGIDNAVSVGLSDSERQALEERAAAAEAKAVECEQRANAVESTINNTLTERSNKMRDALNKKLKESKEKSEQELREAREKLQEEFQLRVEQEKKIWMAEQGTVSSAQNGVPATPVKPSEGRAPQTPLTSTPVDFSKLTDLEIREFITTNPTVRSILTANVKKKVDVEAKKAREEAEQAVKSEYDAKIVAARESEKQLIEKKALLRQNMAEGKIKQAQAKLDVVSNAARDTPQRAVVEVWDIAKSAKPAPAQPAPAQSTPATAPPAQGTTVTPTATPAAAEVKPQATKSIPQPPKPSPLPTAASSQTTAGSPAGTGVPPSVPANPFATATIAPPPANPFSQSQQLGGQQPNPQQQRSGIPVPGGRGGGGRGGPRGGGVYQAPGGRGGPGGGRGRGGPGGPGSRVSSGAMNPAANDFNPGNKRRSDLEAGGGGKRQRGGGPAP